MGLYKEENHWLMKQFKRQEQVYNDSCDYGIPVSGATDMYCHYVRETLLEDNFLFNSLKKHRTSDKNERWISVTIKVYLPWEEQADGFDTTEWNITYYDDLVRKVRFISFSNKPVFGVPRRDIWEADNGKK